MTELVHEKKTREIGAGDVVSRGALPELPPFSFIYRISGALASVPPGAEGSFASFSISATSATDATNPETYGLT